MACFNHKTLGEEELACQLERAASAVPNIIKVKLKHNEDERERSLDDIYMNLPVVSRDERELTRYPDKKDDHIVKIETKDVQSKIMKKQKEKGVSIECQRLNKNKVLEKINVEVSPEVFEALQEMNPNITIKKNTSKSWRVLELDSAYFYLEKSMQEVKSAIEWLKNWKSCHRYRFSRTKVTSL